MFLAEELMMVYVSARSAVRSTIGSSLCIVGGLYTIL